MQKLISSTKAVRKPNGTHDTPGSLIMEGSFGQDTRNPVGRLDSCQAQAVLAGHLGRVHAVDGLPTHHARQTSVIL